MVTISREDGFTVTELLFATTILLIIVSGALQTFNQGLQINDSATQLADANQNLRAGTNQLVRDIMMAGRIIGSEGISMPTGVNVTFKRPGPVDLNFNLVADPNDLTAQLPSITTGYQLGPAIQGVRTDIITIVTIDEFMQPIMTPPDPTAVPSRLNSPAQNEGILSPDGTSVTLNAGSPWLVGDTTADTPKIEVGDLVYYKNVWGNAIQTVTGKDATHIYFKSSGSEAANDFFKFNQPSATTGNNMPLAVMKGSCTTAGNPACSILTPAEKWYEPGPPVRSAPSVTLFKALMITYYVDNTTTPGTPRLTRVINHCISPCTTPGPFDPQALAGVVEDLDLKYDVVDGVVNPTNLTSLPFTDADGINYSANQIRKVNIHVGVRSETMSKPANDYVRNHITTSVNVRSLTAVDRYPTS